MPIATQVDTDPEPATAVLSDEPPAALGAARRPIRRAVGAGSLFDLPTGAQAELLRLVRPEALAPRQEDAP